MTPTRSIVAAGTAGAIISIVLVWQVRMPLPFAGASVMFAAIYAFALTLVCIAWMPERWLWKETERLIRAFKAHHNLSDAGTSNALSAITSAHARADVLRRHARNFHDDLRPEVEATADRLDASAREIFYAPERLAALQPILARSELIQDATRAHAKLRDHAQHDNATVAQSRKTLINALDAMERAFAASDLSVARGHLEKVKIASSVAEILLAPRSRLSRLNVGDPL